MRSNSHASALQCSNPSTFAKQIFSGLRVCAFIGTVRPGALPLVDLNPNNRPRLNDATLFKLVIKCKTFTLKLFFDECLQLMRSDPQALGGYEFQHLERL